VLMAQSVKIAIVLALMVENFVMVNVVLMAQSVKIAIVLALVVENLVTVNV
ncbi:1078_t:CDS:2, partial [Racocetra persica]